MSRVQHAARCLHRLQQVPARARSTVAAVQDAAATTSEWDSARPYRDIPGPKPLPVIGNAWRFMPWVGQYHGLGFDELVRALHAEFGPICKLAGMPRPDMVLLQDADAVQTVFRNEGKWPSRRGAYILEHFFRDVRKNFTVSLAASQGKDWQDFRSKVNQVMMQPRNIGQYVGPIENVAQDFTDRMRRRRTQDGRMPADFIKDLSKWSLESISYVSLDTRLGLLEDNLDPTSDAAVLFATMEGLFDLVYDLDFKPSPWQWVSTPAYRKFIGGMGRFTEIASKHVDQSMTRLKSMSKEDLEKHQRSVLENLLLNTDDPNAAVAMALDMLLGGVDTITAVMSTVLYQLAIHPEKQAALQEELDRVIPDKSKPITKEQMEQLKYLRACIKETMRYMPTIPCNFRDAGKDHVLKGYQVPKGTMTALSGSLMHKDEKYFPQADQFLPERWLAGGSAIKGSHPFAFLPFGFGPRMCVGKRFADLEMETLVAKIFRNFTLEWNQPPAEYEILVVFRFSTPLQFTVKDRS